LDPTNENRIVCGYQRVYESFNLGDTWTFVGSNFSNGNSLTEIAISPSNSNDMYASTNAQIWRKVNGLDWTSCTLPSGVSSITGIEVDNDTSEILYFCSAGFISGKKVFRSEDAGATWTNITYDLPNLPVTALRLLHTELGAQESGVFVGNIGNVYFLKNGETTWRKFGCIPATEVSDIEIQYSTNKVFIGTHGRGIFSTKMDNFELLGMSEPTAEETMLIYPNPTDGFISISSDEHIESIFIYDELLRKVYEATEVNQGTEVQLNVQHLARGTYLIELKSNSGKRVFDRLVKE
jgi:hypothetical protein